LTEQPAADERELSIATTRPTLRQQRLALAVIGMLSIGFVAIAPFAAKQVVQVASFVPTVEAIIFVSSFTTAVLLFSQFSILGSRKLLLLASGYLFAALIVIPHALSYPGAFSPKGLLGPGIQATPWLYVFWHFGFSAVVLGYACLLDTNSKKLFIHDSGMPAICLSAGIVVILVCALTWSVVATEEIWPRLLANEVNFTPLTNYVAVIPFVTSTLAFIVLWIRPRSILDLWLAVAIFATVVEQAISCFFIFHRYSVGAYATRTFSVIVSTLVLSAMLSESVRVYGSLARTNRMLRRERENKLTNLSAVVAAITHELRQPLTGISTKSAAARRYLKQEPPNTDRAQAILGDLGSASLRIDEVLKSVGALFRSTNSEQQPIDINELTLEAIKIIREELTRYDIVIKTQLADELPSIAGHRGQLQEVLLNLIQNAIDAMRTITNRSRVIRLGTKLQDAKAVVISVEDSGPGIEPQKMTRVFDAFVTTKATGMGLGLALSQMIIERHGGQIVVVPSANHGAHFRITLPINSSSPGVAVP
jgi:signal transduction histidine kinase